jgi:hypothetical protein
MLDILAEIHMDMTLDFQEIPTHSVNRYLQRMGCEKGGTI